MAELYALVFAGAVAATVLLMWGLCKAAPRLGLLDHPLGRKAHADATPAVGGLAILLGAIAALILVMLLQDRATVLVGVFVNHLGFSAGAAVLLLTGIIDDWRPIPARYKLLVQLFSCVIAVFGDQALVGDIGVLIGAHSLSLGPLVGPFTVLVMLTVTNAMNMIDGVDGLAAGITLVALAIMTKALATAGFSSTPYMIALIGGVVGFLFFNFPIFPGQKARAFLGDSGSLLFGFTLAYTAIEISALPNRVFKPSTGLYLFLIPVADTIWIYLRRMWIARAPFAAGRDHIHHLLMERFSPRITTWILVGTSALLAGGAYAAERLGVDNSIMILTWIGLFLIYGIWTHKPWKRAWDRSRAAAEMSQEA